MKTLEILGLLYIGLVLGISSYAGFKGISMDIAVKRLRNLFSGARNHRAPHPTLRQSADLTPEDFRLHPIWVSVHTLDYDEDWYNETGEETFRPWLGDRPVGVDETFLVSACLKFADGSEFDGFATPCSFDSGLDSMGTLQPCVFAPSGEIFAFWHGKFRQVEHERRFYQSFSKSPGEVFPISFRPLNGLTSGIASGEIPGFMSIPGDIVITK
jgi:hypothetical protein